MFIAAHPQLLRYRDELQCLESRSPEEENTLTGVVALLKYLHEDHGATIAEIANLLENKEITYELLYAILVPGALLVSTTGELCAYELKSYVKQCAGYVMQCETLDAIDIPKSEDAEDSVQPETLVGPARFGRVQRTLSIERFEGVVKIAALDAYPMKHHHDEAGLRSVLLARARKWVDLYGVHHMEYKGTATKGCSKYKVQYALLKCLSVMLLTKPIRSTVGSWLIEVIPSQRFAPTLN